MCIAVQSRTPASSILASESGIPDPGGSSGHQGLQRMLRLAASCYYYSSIYHISHPLMQHRQPAKIWNVLPWYILPGYYSYGLAITSG